MRSLLLALLFGLCSATSVGQSPVLAYDFDAGGAGSAVNGGTAGPSAMPLSGLTMTGASPIGPPTTKRPVGFTWKIVSLSSSSDGKVGRITCSMTSSRIFSLLTSAEV